MISQQTKWLSGFGLFVAVEIALIMDVDRTTSHAVHELDATHHGLINLFRAYTDFGKGYWYLWPSAIGAIISLGLARCASWPTEKRTKFSSAGKHLLFFFACIASSGLIIDVLKRIIGRARPVMLIKENFYGFHPFSFAYDFNSLPSGHATTAFAVAFALSVLWPRWRFGFLTYACLLALSRVMVNAHFLSDVCAGAAISFATVSLVQKVFRRWGWRPSTSDG